MVLAIGGVALLVLGYGLVEAGAAGIAQIVLPLCVAGTLWASLPALRRR